MPHTLLLHRLGFKQAGRALKAHTARPQSKLLHIYDRLSNYNFLIDTGAEVSILPAAQDHKSLPFNTHFFAANGTKIPVFTRETLQLTLDLHRSFTWTFFVGAVSKPTRGRFLTHFNLMVEMRNQKLADPFTSLSTRGKATPGESTGLSTICCGNQFASLLKGFPDLTQPYSATNPVKHHVTHSTETTGPPVYAKARRLAHERYCQVKAEFESLPQQGIILPSSSNWSFVLHVVSKESSDIRLCGDCRALNTRTQMENYPVPNGQEFLQFHGSTIFSRIDLVKEFHKIPINPEDIPKTAIITPFHPYECTRLPFGLKISAQTFQRFIFLFLFFFYILETASGKLVIINAIPCSSKIERSKGSLGHLRGALTFLS